MEKFFFKKVELWIILVVLLLLLVGNLYWLYRVSVDKAFPYKNMRELKTFLEKDEEYEDRTLVDEIGEKVFKVYRRHLVSSRKKDEARLQDRFNPGVFPDTIHNSCLAVATSVNNDLAVVLYKNDEIVHIWNGNYDRVFGVKEENKLNRINGTLILPDGSVVINYSDYKWLAKLDIDGNPIWLRKDFNSHHSVTLTDRNTIWTPARLRNQHNRTILHAGKYEDYLVELDLDSGETIREIFVSDVLYQNSLHGLYRGLKIDDQFHLNDVQEVGDAFAKANPKLGLEGTDVIMNGKNMNAIVIFSPDTLEVRYVRHYPWNNPHDPDPMPDGWFMLFDNNQRLQKVGYDVNSRILLVNPSTDEVKTLFAADWFYSATQSDQEPFGENILVTSHNSGLIFNVVDGEINFWMTRPEGKKNIFVDDAHWLSADYFENPRLSALCQD